MRPWESVRHAGSGAKRPDDMRLEQKERRVEIWSRTGAGWELVVVEPPADAVHLPELGIRISLDETYRNSGR